MERDNDDDAPLSRWWVLPIVSAGVIVTGLIYQVSSFVRAEAAGICAAVLLLIVVGVWDSRRQRWFLPFVISTVVVESLAIWLIPWPLNHEFQKADLNFVWLDWLLLFGAGSVIQRFFDKKK